MAAAAKAPPAPKLPAEAPFWIKYSPHHELSISSLVSLAWHTLALLLIVAVAFVVSWNNNSDMPIEAVQIGVPGGGGNPLGVGPNRGDGGLVEAAAPRDLPSDAVVPAEPLTDIADLAITAADLLKDMNIDKQAEREIAKIAERGTQALQKLSKLDKKTREGLLGPAGKGGTGAGGGQGTGDGPGVGPGEGAVGSIRAARKLRWTIMFNTTSGLDYLRQLDLLGAILAVKHPDGELRTIRKLLERPAKLEVEDLRKLNRIFWIDDKPDTVEQLASAMGLPFTPPQVVALFPYKFEQELLDKELKFRNRKESDILETRFQILMRAGRTYQVVVIDQRYVY